MFKSLNEKNTNNTLGSSPPPLHALQAFTSTAPCPSPPVDDRWIELKTTPPDFHFPTTNQTRHCFSRYIEFHRVKGLTNVRDLLNTTALSFLVNG
ncbi:hypothetical protein GQ457_04G023490 [Hibiscus cannabinus]